MNELSMIDRIGSYPVSIGMLLVHQHVVRFCNYLLFVIQTFNCVVSRDSMVSMGPCAVSRHLIVTGFIVTQMGYFAAVAL
jgi:hypothetical protein